MKTKVHNALESKLGSPDFMRGLGLVDASARFYGEGMSIEEAPRIRIKEASKISVEDYFAHLTKEEVQVIKEMISHLSETTPSYRVLAIGSSVHNSMLPTREDYSDIDLVFYAQKGSNYPKGAVRIKELTLKIEGQKEEVKSRASGAQEIEIIDRSAMDELLQNFAPWAILQYTERGWDTTKQGIRFIYCNGTFQETYQNLCLEVQHPDYSERRFNLTFTDSGSLIYGILETNKEVVKKRRQEYIEKHKLRRTAVKKLFLPEIVELHTPKF